MNDYDELALDLCDKYGIVMPFANEAALWILSDDIPEDEAIADLLEKYGDAVYE